METRKSGFTILPSNEKPHQKKQYGTGLLDLNSLSSVILQEERAWVDMGALHAKSEVERGIRFTADRAEVPDGKTYWIVWVAMDHAEGKGYYAGLTCSEMIIDRESRKGYKSLPHHVKAMEGALKRRFDLSLLRMEEKEVLARFLKETNEQAWNHAPEELHRQLDH